MGGEEREILALENMLQLLRAAIFYSSKEIGFGKMEAARGVRGGVGGEGRRDGGDGGDGRQ